LALVARPYRTVRSGGRRTLVLPVLYSAILVYSLQASTIPHFYFNHGMKNTEKHDNQKKFQSLESCHAGERGISEISKFEISLRLRRIEMTTHFVNGNVLAARLGDSANFEPK
jgi:hypothetical protein